MNSFNYNNELNSSQINGKEWRILRFMEEQVTPSCFHIPRVSLLGRFKTI
jgi:hypothetical protein